MLTDNSEKPKGNDENHHIVNEALSEIVLGLPTVSIIAKTSIMLTDPKTAELLVKQSRHPLCQQVALAVGAQGSKYPYNCNEFLISFAHIDGAP